MENKPVRLTQKGLEELKKEYDDLVNNLIAKNISDIATAKEYGDLSENSDYKFAKERQAKYDQRKYELEYIFDNYQLIEDIDTSKVTIGVSVEVFNKSTNENEIYKIVDSIEEVDPFVNKISLECPLGRAIANKSVGDLCEVKVKKPYQVKIVSINK